MDAAGFVGVWVVSRECEAWAGECEHGTLAEQEDRTQHNQCASCNAGYYLDGISCAAYAGECEHGELREQSLRTADNHCGQCNSGYYMTQYDHFIGQATRGDELDELRGVQTAEACMDHCDADPLCKAIDYATDRPTGGDKGAGIPPMTCLLQGDADARQSYADVVPYENLDCYVKRPIEQCSPFAGVCANGQLIEQDKRVQHKHCGTCKDRKSVV